MPFVPWGAGMAGMGSGGSVVSQPGVLSIGPAMRAAHGIRIAFVISRHQWQWQQLHMSSSSQPLSLFRAFLNLRAKYWRNWRQGIATNSNTLIAEESYKTLQANGKCIQDFTPASITSATDWPWDRRIWREECCEDWLILTESLQDLSQVLQHKSFLAGLRYPHFGTANGIMRRGPRQSSTLTQAQSEL